MIFFLLLLAFTAVAVDKTILRPVAPKDYCRDKTDFSQFEKR